jgi:phosphoglycolate phosphatase
MPGFRYIVFDLDGTLVDSLPGIAWSIDSAFAECGLPTPPCNVGQLIGPPIRQILARIAGTTNAAFLDRLEQAFRRNYDSEGWRKTQCFTGVQDLLHQLVTRGAELFLVTNKPAQVTGKILHQLNLSGFFQEVACRGTESSKAVVLASLLKRRGLDPQAGLMVGDTSEDSAAASAAGMACRIVSPSTKEELTI